MAGMETMKIGPALTSEEWAEPLVGEYPYVMVDLKQRDLSEHGIAAKLLYGQPFGFTREDVDMLTGPLIREPVGPIEVHYSPEAVAFLHSLADRIEALLPPDARLQPPDLGYTQEQCNASGIQFVREGSLWPDTPPASPRN